MVFDVFLSMSTQWRMGPNGPIGLDYAAIPAVMSLLNVKKKSRSRLFRDLQVIEYAALEEMSRQRAKKR